MVTRALMIEWGMPKQGFELKALAEFKSAHEFFSALKNSGKIEEFRLYGPLTGNQEERTGLVLLEGTDQQIAALRDSEEYRVLIVRIVTVGTMVTITELETGERMMTRVLRYGRVVKEFV